MADTTKKWSGAAPENCDLCQREIERSFVDGKTKMGPWAMMCELSHSENGVGLGVGKGSCTGRRPSS